jgi:hypothetical protein
VPVVVRDRVPLVPLTVNVNTPRGVGAVLIVSTEAAVGMTNAEENEPDDPTGRPLTDNETGPPNPFTAVTVTT